MKNLWIIVFTVFAFACTTEESPSEIISSEKLAPVQISYAKGFKIIAIDNGYQLNIFNPADTSETQFTYKFSREKKEGFIQIPLKNVISLSTTHLGMIGLLKELNSVKGISEKKYVCNESLIHAIENGDCKEVFGLDKANFEDYLLIQPDAVIYSGFDNTVPVLVKLKEAQLTPIANYEWRETHPLGRAEWIKFFGLIYDKLEMADSIFEQEVKQYNSLKNNISSSSKPSVIMGAIYADVWYTPAGESYTAKLLSDAGGDYVYKSSLGTGSISFGAEEVFADNQETEVWIDPPATSLQELKAMQKTYSLIGPTKKEKVYSYANNSNCFWENAAAQPHLVLEDFIGIFQEKNDSTFNFYKKLK